MKKFISLIFIFFMFNSCMVDIGLVMVNEKGDIHDIYDDKRFPIFVETAISTVEPSEALMKNRSDSANSALAYVMEFLGRRWNPVKITIHSFSFKRLNGEEIPSIMYYETDTGYVFIKQFPYVFNPEDTLFFKYGLEVIAECKESYQQTKAVVINFDIEVGNVRVDTSITYKTKLYFDWRPKFL